MPKIQKKFESFRILSIFLDLYELVCLIGSYRPPAVSTAFWWGLELRRPRLKSAESLLNPAVPRRGQRQDFIVIGACCMSWAPLGTSKISKQQEFCGFFGDNQWFVRFSQWLVSDSNSWFKAFQSGSVLECCHFTCEFPFDLVWLRSLHRGNRRTSIQLAATLVGRSWAAVFLMNLFNFHHIWWFSGWNMVKHRWNRRGRGHNLAPGRWRNHSKSCCLAEFGRRSRSVGSGGFRIWITDFHRRNG